MLSQNTLVWVGGTAASTVVAAGAVAGAMLWTHPGFLWPNPAATQAVVNAPEPKAPGVPPAVQTATPTASAPALGGDAASEAAAPPLKPTFDVVNVAPTGEAVIAGRGAPKRKSSCATPARRSPRRRRTPRASSSSFRPRWRRAITVCRWPPARATGPRKRPAWSRSLFPGRKPRSLRRRPRR